MNERLTSPIAYSGIIFNNETKLELLLQKNIKHGNPLHAIAEERVCLEPLPTGQRVLYK